MAQRTGGWAWAFGGCGGGAALLCACSLLVETGDLASGGAAEDASRTDGDGGAPNEASVPDAAPADASGDDAGQHPYVGAVLADAPRAYYRFEETSGDPRDEMNRVSGVYSGACALGAPGIFAGSAAVSFDGTQAGVLLDAAAFEFEGRAPFTVETWFSPRAYGNYFGFVFAKDNYDMDRREAYGVWMHGEYGFSFERHVGAVKEAIYAERPTVGRFHHIVASYDGTLLKLYVDTVLLGTNPDTRDAPAKGVPFRIGQQYVDGPSVDGIIDEVAIYDKALDVDRIRAHYLASGR